jgi:peptidoglycan hydrolase-like protein with peptidoglycan-binding domain
MYSELQVLLKKKNLYDGSIDGKVGPKTLDAIALLIQSYGISTKGWSKTKLKIAGEQALYKSMGIEIGKMNGENDIDGIDDHVLGNARDVYVAKTTISFRDSVEALVEAKATIVQPIPVKTSGKIVPLKEWPRQKDCMKFYGKPGTNQVTLKLPYPMRIAWEPKKTVKSWSCHAKVHDSMERLFQRTLDHYGMEKIRELRLDMWGGTLNVRKMRGGSSWSQHSWGIAVDIDPDNNQLKWGKDRATLAKPIYNKFWEFVYDEGAISLGKERNFDWMHLQFSRL